jgi:hypothetical protein
MMKTISDDDIVEVSDAIIRITRWRTAMGEQFPIKAFYITKEDIEALHSEIIRNEAIAVRAYLAVDNKGENEILLVGVTEDPLSPNGKDLYEVGGKSRIYDLTSPCPNMCDCFSPLYTLRHSEEVNAQLGDL